MARQQIDVLRHLTGLQLTEDTALSAAITDSSDAKLTLSSTGLWLVHLTCAGYLATGDTNVDADASDFPVGAYQLFPIYVSSTTDEGFVSGIAASGLSGLVAAIKIGD